VAFELGEEASTAGDISIDSTLPHAPVASIVAAPSAQPITTDMLESGIEWADPSEGAFWERLPRTQLLSLGVRTDYFFEFKVQYLI
jgi:hypothetical protein